MQRRVAVAASGGRDSTALLHATCRAARELGLEVVALHVHHGLMPQADAWLDHVRRQCARWSKTGLPVRFRAQVLAGQPGRGASVEAWARHKRYAALASMAHDEGIGLVLLAHHRSDQAETFLLQALRGSGPAGLSAMPARAERQGIVWCRPWLDQPAAAIEAYVRRFRLRHVDDASNEDARYARSRLRTQVWPALERAFPGVDLVLAQAARRAQEAAQSLRECGDADLRSIAADATQLPVPAWTTLGDARRANALRIWLANGLPGGAPESLTTRLLRDLPTARAGSAWPTPAGPLRLHRSALRWAATPLAVPGDTFRPIDLSSPGTHAVPEWGGEFVVTRSVDAGISADRLARAELRPRHGGERFQRAPNAMPRSLKKEFQTRGLSVDDRTGPLVYADGQLVFVPGLGIDGRLVAQTSGPRVELAWRRTAGLTQGLLHRKS